MSKQIFLGFNWKMNPSTPEEADKLIEVYLQSNIRKNTEVVVFPPSLFLYKVIVENYVQLKYKNIGLGAQDVSLHDKGSHTGQLSAKMYQNIGAEYTIVGHSESRQEFKFNNGNIHTKIHKALENNLKVVYCIGFSDPAHAHEHLRNELEMIFHKPMEENQEVIVAFEPIANIGSGRPMSRQEIDHYIEFIKLILEEKGSKDTKVLYGGSVNASNIKQIAKSPFLDGFLIGGAGLKPDQIKTILETDFE